MNRQAQQVPQQPARVVVRRTEDAGSQTPPPDHEDWKRSQAVGFENIRRIMQNRRRKK